MAEQTEHMDESKDETNNSEGVGSAADEDTAAPVEVQRSVLNLMKLVVYVLCLVMLIHAVVVAAGIEHEKISLDAAGSVMLAPTIALFAMLVTGIFIFATFQIDQKAMAVAKEVADRAVSEKVAKAIKSEKKKMVLRANSAVLEANKVSQKADVLVSEAAKRGEAQRKEMETVLLAVMTEVAMSPGRDSQVVADQLRAKIREEFRKLWADSATS